EKPKTPSSDGGDNKTNPGGDSSNNNPNNGGSVTDGNSNDSSSSNTDMSTSGSESMSQVSEVRNQLKVLLDKKDNELAKYSLYLDIKAKLSQAFESADAAEKNKQATLEQLQKQKADLEKAISDAITSKTSFDSANAMLINSFNELKTFVETTKASEINEINEKPEYAFVKELMSPIIMEVNSIISKGYQENGLTSQSISDKKTQLENKLNDFNESYRANIAEFSSGLSLPINDTNIMSEKNNNNNESMNQTNNIYSANVNLDWKYGQRRFKKDSAWSNIENSKWIYKLEGNSAKYEFKFNNYVSKNLKLIFPYKIMRNDEKPQTELKVEFNDSVIESSLIYHDVNRIDLAVLDLKNAIFGENKLTFSVPDNKKNPLIGNMYIISDASKMKDAIYKLNGQTDEDDGIIKIDLSKAVGGSTSYLTRFESINYSNKDYILLKNTGKFGVNFAQYTFGVYVSEAGEYNVGLTYNSDTWTELYLSILNDENNGNLTTASGFIKIKNEGSFNNLYTTDGVKIKRIDPSQSEINTLKVNLKQGWNNLVIGKAGKISPSIESILLKKV
ncbi:hypothetical protein, partial [Mycoplasma bradburyae]|uniref:hypothetical protein n=1 Tax=Mycoplasma bradburyae TaxID=2963128 RepID=UPI0023412C4F